MNDRETSESLFFDNTGLVPYTIRKYTAMTVDEDIMQEGLLGLWKAALHYDTNSAIRFPTYAVQCIRNQIWSGERTKIRGNIPNTVSLQERVMDNSKTTYMDLVKDPKAEEPYLDLETEDMFDKFFTDEEKAILTFRLKGIGLWRASNMLGHSGDWGKTRIRRIKVRLKRRDE